MRIEKYQTILLFLFLGTLVSFGPFITDMYLVALPDMMRYFSVEKSTIQLTLTFSMLGLACGQVFFGYIGDKYGRKIPLICSLVLFSSATILCVISNELLVLVCNRFLQGFAGAGGIVLARSIIPDLFHRALLTKAISVTTFIYTINRIVSPLLGGFAFELSGWKGIFISLAIIGVILTIASFFIPETNAKTAQSAPVTLRDSFKSIIHNRQFLYFMSAFTFILTAQFAYIASCSFIFQKHYMLSPLVFSYVFAFNAAIFGVGALIPARKEMSVGAIKNTCYGLFAICVALFLIPVVNGNVYVYEVLLIGFRLMTGICFTLFMAKALDACRDNAGFGAAVLGTFYFLFGSVVSPLVGYGNMFYSSAAIMSFFSLLTCFIVYKALQKINQ